MEGRRFYFPRDLEGFLNGNAPADDGAGGGFSEFAMLSLRLTEGLQRKICETRFENGGALFDGVLEGCKHLPKNLIHADYERISLSRGGLFGLQCDLGGSFAGINKNSPLAVEPRENFFLCLFTFLFPENQAKNQTDERATVKHLP